MTFLKKYYLHALKTKQKVLVCIENQSLYLKKGLHVGSNINKKLLLGSSSSRKRILSLILVLVFQN
jgi:hypothetical protein